MEFAGAKTGYTPGTRIDGDEIRVIALENLVIALLVQACEPRLDLVRDMAAHISPRPGFTPHRLTIHAAAEMISLVDRAGNFRV